MTEQEYKQVEKKFEDELKAEHTMFADLWKFYKQYRSSGRKGKNEEYWKDVTEEASELHKKHHTELCKNMILQILNELEHKNTP